MKIATKNKSGFPNNHLRKSLRSSDSALNKEPDVADQDKPVLSDSLLRRIDYARHLNNQNTNIHNLPLLPILKYDSRKNLSASKSGLNSGRSQNSASRFSRIVQSQLKKVPKSTKISEFNKMSLNEPAQMSSMSLSSSNSFNSSSSTNNSGDNHNILMDNLFDSAIFNFKEKLNPSNQLSSQSNLLRNLRMNDIESSNTAEIIVRPIPVKSHKTANIDEAIGFKKQGINLAPLIKNFRLNSFDFQKLNNFNISSNKMNDLFKQLPENSIEFNIDKPKLKKNIKAIQNDNDDTKQAIEFVPATNRALKPIHHGGNNKSINYLAASIEGTNTSSLSSYASVNRKLELDDFEYYDLNELFRKNTLKVANFPRKNLSQINEESTIDGTPMSNSRWSSSLSNFSDHTRKSSDISQNDIWSDIDESTNLPIIRQNRMSNKTNSVPLAIE